MDFYTTALLQGLAFCALGIGIFLTLRIFNIPDITTDGSYTLGGALTAVLLVRGLHPVAVLPVAAAGGALAGVCTGLIHTRLRVHALLAGILVMTALYSVNLVVMGRSNIPLLQVGNVFDVWPVFPGEQANRAFVLCLSALLLFGGITWLLHTDFGIAMRATGSNEAMARAMGVHTDGMKVAGLALANALTAVSGCLMVQYQGFSDINMGIGVVISGLASVIIGTSLVRLSGRRTLAFQVAGVVAGTVLFRLVLAATLAAGLHPNYLRLVTSLVVLAVLAGGLLVRKERQAA
jgi:putative ABC transport system permease protein